MSPYGLKWVEMGSNGFNWVQMDPNVFNWVQMGQNGSKWAQIGQNGLTWVKDGPNRGQIVIKLGFRKLDFYVACKKCEIMLWMLWNLRFQTDA